MDVSNIPVHLCLCIWGSRCALTRAYAPACFKKKVDSCPKVIAIFLGYYLICGNEMCALHYKAQKHQRKKMLTYHC